MKIVWEVWDQVVRTRGGNMVGHIKKIGPNKTDSSSIANITVEWSNGHIGKVAAHQIRLSTNEDVCGHCKWTVFEHHNAPCANGITRAS